MTLYFNAAGSGDIRPDDDVIIENHPEYVEMDDDGRLIINLDEMGRQEKRKSLLRAAASAIEASDEYELVTEPEVEWRGGETQTVQGVD